jgi:hypothetical protein
MARRQVVHRGLLVSAMALVVRHPYWLLWAVALTVLVSERGW